MICCVSQYYPIGEQLEGMNPLSEDGTNTTLNLSHYSSASSVMTSLSRHGGKPHHPLFAFSGPAHYSNLNASTISTMNLTLSARRIKKTTIMGQQVKAWTRRVGLTSVMSFRWHNQEQICTRSDQLHMPSSTASTRSLPMPTTPQGTDSLSLVNTTQASLPASGQK